MRVAASGGSAPFSRTLNHWKQTRRRDSIFPWYQSPYIGTSPNHYAQWAQLLYLAGELFDRPKWKELGGRILRRFAAVEQSPDGFWGEHTRLGPTIGYNHLTLSAVAFYYEHSKDPVALEALRRALTFHENFTYPDGTPVETMNNRNRYWNVQRMVAIRIHALPDGRRYAEFLSQFFKPDNLTMDQLGRLAQDVAVLSRGAHGADPAGRLSIRMGDEHPGRNPQDRPVDRLAFRHH